MRVPADPNNPTYDNTFNVGFWRWLTSNAAERKEWARRRNAATRTGNVARKLDQAYNWAGEKQAEADARRQQRRRQRHQH